MPANPEDSRPHTEDNPEDGGAKPEESGQIPRIRRQYNLSDEGREHLSELGRARWAAEEDAEQREQELAERERRVRAAEATPESERLARLIRREIRALPEIVEGGLLQVNGTDYRLNSEKGLVHVYWPKGERTSLDEGECFQFEGRAYSVGGGSLKRVPSERLLARLLEPEA
jgi:hypothetical protein